jgi:hypothetical protein
MIAGKWLNNGEVKKNTYNNEDTNPAVVAFC